jgi:hypothetical protein
VTNISGAKGVSVADAVAVAVVPSSAVRGSGVSASLNGDGGPSLYGSTNEASGGGGAGAGRGGVGRGGVGGGAGSGRGTGRSGAPGATPGGVGAGGSGSGSGRGRGVDRPAGQGAGPPVPDTPARVEDIVWRRDTSHLFGASFLVPVSWELEPSKAPASVEFRCPRGEAAAKSFKVFVADLTAVTSKTPEEKLAELVAHYKQKAESQVCVCSCVWVVDLRAGSLNTSVLFPLPPPFSLYDDSPHTQPVSNGDATSCVCGEDGWEPGA